MANSHGKFFNRVKIAREALREKAEEIIEEYLDVAMKAKDAGDYETAAKSLQWLIEHMPADDDGKGIVDTSVDKQKQQLVEKPAGPAIQIGIQVGGIGAGQQQPALPAPKVEIIDVK